MRLRLSQIATRVACCAGLLLVAAVQQKLCALPPAHRPAAEPPRVPAPDGSRRHKKTRPRLTLSVLVPDVAPPRWPGHLRLAATQRGKPLPAAAWQSGAGRADHAGPAVSTAPVDRIALRRVALRPVRIPAAGGFALRSAQRSAAVFRTALLRTGPPAV